MKQFQPVTLGDNMCQSITKNMNILDFESVSDYTYPRGYYSKSELSAPGLFEAANKVAHNNEVKAEIREEIVMFRELLMDWPEGEIKEVTYREWTEELVCFEKTEWLSKEQAKDKVRHLEELLNKLSDKAQMDLMELQEQQQQSQQMFQMMSSQIKTQHDTLKSLISNLR
jgi:hypothetical protein